MNPNEIEDWDRTKTFILDPLTIRPSKLLSPKPCGAFEPGKRPNPGSAGCSSGLDALGFPGHEPFHGGVCDGAPLWGSTRE